MPYKVKTYEEYQKVFDSPKKRREALHYALDIRKFEIELYWKRTAYFWTLIAVAFAGYFALEKSSNAKDSDSELLFLVSCIGTVLSIGWSLANRGSKYWQENWERHVDTLEDEFIGPLYRTVISSNKYKWYNLCSAYPYSVSRINQIISYFIVLLWAGMTVSAFPASSWKSLCQEFPASAMLGIITMMFILALVFFGKTKSASRPRKIRFLISYLKNSSKRETDV